MREHRIIFLPSIYNSNFVRVVYTSFIKYFINICKTDIYIFSGTMLYVEYGVVI